MTPEPLLDRQGKPVPYTEAAAALLLVSLPDFSVTRLAEGPVTVGWGVPLVDYHQAHGVNFIEAVFEACSWHWYKKPWRPHG